MRTKSLILIFIALGCGLVASIGISQVMEARSGQNTQVEMSPILVTLVDMDIGAKLDAKNLKLEEWPVNKIPEGAVTSLKDVEERFTRVRLFKGEPILQSKISSDGMDVTTHIPPGFRVVVLKLEQDTVIGLIQPGDRVDIMAFFRRTTDIPFTGTRTILTNVRVFAVGKDVERTVDKDGKQIEAKTVSVLVKQDQAEKLTIALEMGKIRLSLRPPNEKDDHKSDTTSLANDLFSNKQTDASGGDHAAPAAANVLQSIQQAMSAATAPSTEPEHSPPSADTSGKFEMQIITPTGVQRFEWTGSRKDLPKEIVPPPANAASAGPPGYFPEADIPRGAPPGAGS